jgi:hypothetical protein
MTMPNRVTKKDGHFGLAAGRVLHNARRLGAPPFGSKEQAIHRSYRPKLLDIVRSAISRSRASVSRPPDL